MRNNISAFPVSQAHGTAGLGRQACQSCKRNRHALGYQVDGGFAGSAERIVQRDLLQLGGLLRISIFERRKAGRRLRDLVVAIIIEWHEAASLLAGWLLGVKGGKWHRSIP